MGAEQIKVKVRYETMEGCHRSFMVDTLLLIKTIIGTLKSSPDEETMGEWLEDLRGEYYLDPHFKVLPLELGSEWNDSSGIILIDMDG